MASARGAEADQEESIQRRADGSDPARDGWQGEILGYVDIWCAIHNLNIPLIENLEDEP
jgi:hypothetical protein